MTRRSYHQTCIHLLVDGPLPCECCHASAGDIQDSAAAHVLMHNKERKKEEPAKAWFLGCFSLSASDDASNFIINMNMMIYLCDHKEQCECDDWSSSQLIVK